MGSENISVEVTLVTLKILVAGHFNAGKTTFVKNASENLPLLTEKQTSSERERNLKPKTTVAMDFSSIREENFEVKIFGIPGQDRFSFMWEILSRNTHGFIFLIDSTREDMWDDTIVQMRVMLKGESIPFIVCANKQDLPEAKEISYIRHRMKNLYGIEEIYPCVATDKEVVKQLISILIQKIMESLDRETPVQEGTT
ncbi:MAG: GTP-binding protein [Aquifex sp.]|nr:MAG: GTP-binding protein [Aquifex sp.]